MWLSCGWWLMCLLRVPSTVAGPADISSLYSQFWNNPSAQGLHGFENDQEDMSLDEWLDDTPMVPDESANSGNPAYPEMPAAPPSDDLSDPEYEPLPGWPVTRPDNQPQRYGYGYDNYANYYDQQAAAASSTGGGERYSKQYMNQWANYYASLASNFGQQVPSDNPPTQPSDPLPPASSSSTGGQQPAGQPAEDGRTMEELVEEINKLMGSPVLGVEADPFQVYSAWFKENVGGLHTGVHIPAAATGPHGNVTEVAGIKYVPLALSMPNKRPSPGIPNKAPKEEIVYPEIPLLVDPSPMDLPKEECITADGEVGECHSAYQCGYTNGVYNGLCHQGMDSSAHTRVCCVYPSYCGYETNREVTYFKNPGYPSPTTNHKECHFRVNLLPGVCQLRVDFLELKLKPMENGECEAQNRLTVKSRLKRAHVPVQEFCGKLHRNNQDPTSTDLSHMYVHIEDIPLDSAYVEPPNSPKPSVDFRVSVKDYPSKWNIRISQVQCDGAPLHAPSGCSQFYNQPNGTITSLNVADQSYLNNLKMSACIRPDLSACGIRYLIKEMQFGDVKNKRQGTSKQLGYGLTCQDYITFNGMKSGMCGATSNKEIILPINGPQGLSIVTDGIHSPSTDQGFRIQYSFIHNCDNTTNFFNFPTAK